MDLLPSTTVLLPPAATFALLGALALLPAPLLAYWRHRALHAPADPERPAWFTFALRVQLMVLASALVVPNVAARLPVRSALIAAGAMEPSLLVLAPLVLLLAPTIVHVLMATLVSGDVERRLRGTSWGSRQRLRLLAHRAFTMAPLATGLVLGPIVAARWGSGPGGATLCGGVLVTLFLAGTRQQMLGMTLEAETVGPLRDRVFALAARAGVPLRQVYVLSARSARIANAFAVHGGKVLLTDHLLAHLSTAEVEAVVAHELAHLRARHPLKLQWALFGGALLGVPFLWLPLGAWGLAVSGLAGWLVFVTCARRFEREADRGAVQLAGDAEALISALVKLARLGHVPVHWSRAQEAMLTHPSVRRRAEALVASGHLRADRVDALLATTLAERAPDAEPEAADARVFGTPARTRQAVRLSWLGLFVSVAAPVAVLAAAAALHAPRPLAFAAAVAAAFAGVLGAMDAASLSGYNAWGRELAARFGADGRAFVGLSPGDDDTTYEGFADWDLGFLSLEPGVLRFDGEVARFALTRDQVTSVDVTAGMPGWMRTPRVALSWRDTDGATRRLTLRDAGARRMHELPARAHALCEQLRRWQALDATAAAPDLPGEPPTPERVSGTPLRTLASPRTLVPIAVLTGLMTLTLAPLAGLPASPWEGPGVLDAFVSALAAWVLMRLPVWKSERRTSAPPRGEALDRAA